MTDEEGNGLEDEQSFSCWEQLLPDLLAQILARLPFEERFLSAPLVCKRWNRACKEEPHCWTSVDIEPWFLARVQQDFWWEFECDDQIKWIIHEVVDRSRGMLQDLRTMHCCDSSLEYIAHRCPKLVSLGIRNSLRVTDSSAMTLAYKCPLLASIDISDCYNISSAGLEALGRHCPRLIRLKRNMLRNSDRIERNKLLARGDDDEALVLSRSLRGIKHLEMKRGELSDEGLLHIARGCSRLEYLDVSLCAKLSAKGLDAAAGMLEKSLKIFIRPKQTLPDLLWVFFQ
ncbi:hypothetical protein SELMODRAFT_85659 [Selaginella moellendorffii]|uniref:F-box domain-containing protein n=1 Tax=Selaginella moellendorffii TaxID=88036 RepID=D8R5I6_SELML|nr:F-box protein SKIP1 [Selaginella moellendorffii]EFJ32493.1 hypothetical protein SELMODRAFT_85659 [Selaginella moellendorffii]|eukprot:XP_002966466.1 F-box protein SKIP1 [Selaginella moellendorffii]